MQTQDSRQARAVAYLEANGKQAGKDFTPGEAEEKADEMACEVEVGKAVAHLRENKAHTAFSGDESCEDCEGWDGESRRCSCGNRRVSWVFAGDFESPSIYPEAW